MPITLFVCLFEACTNSALLSVGNGSMTNQFSTADAIGVI